LQVSHRPIKNIFKSNSPIYILDQSKDFIYHRWTSQIFNILSYNYAGRVRHIRKKRLQSRQYLKTNRLKPNLKAAFPDAKSYKMKIAIGRFSNETNYGRSLIADQNLDRIGNKLSTCLRAA